jgi:hypothetical protein
MAQVKFGVCVNEFAPRPDLQPGFFGTFVPRDAPRCLGTDMEEKRRKDVPRARYATGEPAITSHQRDPWGVPLKYEGAYDTVQTEQGAIRLTRDDTEGWDVSFIPSVSLLNAVPMQDTRMRSLSDRYYNR